MITATAIVELMLFLCVIIVVIWMIAELWRGL
jgi:hypothetical protein